MSIDYKPLFIGAMAGQVLLLGVVVSATKRQKRQAEKDAEVVVNVCTAAGDLIERYNDTVKDQDLSGVDKLDNIRDHLEYFRLAVGYDLNLGEPTPTTKENPK